MKISSGQNQLFSCVIIYFGALIVDALKSNATNEIFELFGEGNKNWNQINETLGSDNNRNRIFAEGSSDLINIPSQEKSKVLSEATTSKNGNESNPVGGSAESVHQIYNLTYSRTKPAPPKLNQTTLDFKSDMNEVAHASGTSSIKPRKGVSYSKIVPKKGVNIEDFLNYSLPTNHSCFVVNQSNCYDVDYYKNLECTCCNASNDLGKLIGRQPLTNCMTCLPINTVSKDFVSCNGICCENTTKYIGGNNNISSNTSGKVYHVSGANGNISNTFVNVSNVNVLEKSQMKKKKPIVTNVPYDSDVTNPFNKTKGEKYIPIVVSIFILPLVGVLIFFMWKKTRELWDRRYYKRMDFLIDGMYNE